MEDPETGAKLLGETTRDQRDVIDIMVLFTHVLIFTLSPKGIQHQKDLKRSQKRMAIQSSVQQEDDPTDERPTADVLLLFINMRSKFDEAPHGA